MSAHRSGLVPGPRKPRSTSSGTRPRMPILSGMMIISRPRQWVPGPAPRPMMFVFRASRPFSRGTRRPTRRGTVRTIPYPLRPMPQWPRSVLPRQRLVT